MRWIRWCGVESTSPPTPKSREAEPRPPHALGSPTPGVVSLRNLALVRGGLCWLVLWKGVEMVDKITGRRVVAADPLIGDDRYDYADAFEVVLDDTDPRTPEALVRAGLEHAPTVLRYAIIAVHRWILRVAASTHGHRRRRVGMDGHSFLPRRRRLTGGRAVTGRHDHRPPRRTHPRGAHHLRVLPTPDAGQGRVVDRRAGSPRNCTYAAASSRPHDHDLSGRTGHPRPFQRAPRAPFSDRSRSPWLGSSSMTTAPQSEAIYPVRCATRRVYLARANSTMSFTTCSVTRSSFTLWFWDCSRST